MLHSPDRWPVSQIHNQTLHSPCIDQMFHLNPFKSTRGWFPRHVGKLHLNPFKSTRGWFPRHVGKLQVTSINMDFLFLRRMLGLQLRIASSFQRISVCQVRTGGWRCERSWGLPWWSRWGWSTVETDWRQIHFHVISGCQGAKNWRLFFRQQPFINSHPQGVALDWPCWARRMNMEGMSKHLGCSWLPLSRREPLEKSTVWSSRFSDLRGVWIPHVCL